MSAYQSLALTVLVPFDADSAAYTTYPEAPVMPVPPEQQSDYLAALKREVLLTKDFVWETRVTHLIFAGGTAANMTLAYWCGLMDTFAEYYPGSPEALIRFDVPPSLISSKTVQYAVKYHTLMNIRLNALAAPKDTWDADAEKDVLPGVFGFFNREHCVDWGFEVPVHPGAAFCPAAELASRVAELKPNYVRFFSAGAEKDSVSLPSDFAPALEEIGYKELADGFFTKRTVMRKWFANGDASAKISFGLGGISGFDTCVRTTTSDLEEYLAHAGIDESIYTGILREVKPVPKLYEGGIEFLPANVVCVPEFAINTLAPDDDLAVQETPEGLKFFSAKGEYAGKILASDASPAYALALAGKRLAARVTGIKPEAEAPACISVTLYLMS